MRNTEQRPPQTPLSPLISSQALAEAIAKASQYLLSRQSPEGFWVGELEADVTVTAGYIPLMYFVMGKINQDRQRKAVKYILSKQRQDGSWATHYGGPGDLNVTAQAYFALKLAGISADEPFMRRARDFVLGQGGITHTNTLTRIWLALFGQYKWRGVPSIPPEIILLPSHFWFSIYEFASWSRATIVALMVVLTLKPVCRVPDYAAIPELYAEPEKNRDYSPAKAPFFTWQNLFLIADRAFKIYEIFPIRPWRDFALRQVEEWITKHQEEDGSWGGIMLPWVYSLIALKGLGHDLDHPVVARGLAGLEAFIVEDETTFRLQPATSPVWDTAWAVLALREAGLSSNHPALTSAAQWLLAQEIKRSGDWQVKNPGTAPGCWSFEFKNDCYPDIDDTAVVPRALLRLQLDGNKEASRSAVAEGLKWVMSMQSRNGGWAAFDRDSNRKILEYIPFADFMSPIDPTCPDVTAHVLELMADIKEDGNKLKEALSYTKKAQETDGAWYGRWGVNYIYGTGLVLSGIKAAGEDMQQDCVLRAVEWLKVHQNADGGWGETCRTYDDPRTRGIGPSTASQTAWAVTGLVSTGDYTSDAVCRGSSYLLSTQMENGSWPEDAYTGTGFPRAFYLRYDLYRIYFPLLALARYRSLSKGAQDD